MENYTRFKDEKYKNWLKAAESLYILRNNIRGFVEKETETYHRSLQEKLKGDICNKRCDPKKYPPSPKKLPICDACERWKDEILLSYSGKAAGVHWNNCHPYLWPREKWEVAKVYMPRGQTGHRSFDQFDISAILNFMDHCKYFKRFPGQLLSKIINMRNKVMHSPDFLLDENEMKNGVGNILNLAELLDGQGLQKNVLEAIQKFNTILENCLGQDSDGKAENIQLLDREQQALKEKIEYLTQRYEADQNEANKGELLGIRNFLEQNKDLLENLRPQMNRLHEIQERVNKHEDQIEQLSDRVDDLEKAASTAGEGCDSMFTSDTLLFKNHLIEQSRKRKWPEPVFTDEPEANGYRGRVVVNGRIFKGSLVCKKRVTAHQEVAKIALDSLKDEFDSTEEPSSSATMTTSNLFYGTVTVVLDKAVISDGFVKKEEAIESAYSRLACVLRLKVIEDNSFRTLVLEHLHKCHVKPPQEKFEGKDKIICELQLKESFNFNDEDGSSTKKKAEQQAASVALQKLSTFFNISTLTVQNENYKGFLKERLDALGIDSTKIEYKTDVVKATEGEEGPGTSRDALHNYRDEPNECSYEEAQEIDKTALDVESTEVSLTSATIPSVTNSTSSLGTLFYGTVIVLLKTNKEIRSDGFVTKEEAIESAYKKIASLFGLNDLDNTPRTAVLAHFKKCCVKPPQELIQKCPQDDKTFCILHLMECFTFSDNVGCTTKKKAEQQVAKMALQELSSFFNCDSSAVSNENYKGFLKERLEALGMDTTKTEYKIEQKIVTEELEGPGTSRDTSHLPSAQTRQPEQQNGNLQSKDSSAVVQPPPTYQSSCANKTPDVSLSTVPNEVLKDYAEIHSLLTVHNLKPPSVILECFSTDQNVSLRLDIVLDKFTFKNLTDYTSKKDATRKTYYLLGCALGIFPQNTDENKATMLVKQDFSQKSLPPPKEIVDGEKTSFRCSIEEITYNLIYEGQGSTEGKAKQDALEKALLTLPSLFGYPHLSKSNSTAETEGQINIFLRNSGQKDLTFSHQCNQHKVSITLQFSDYTMTSKMQRTKKENRNFLSKRILGLLGVETEPQCPSLRNCLDDWFKKKGLQQPEFTDTEEAQGCKALFSVQLSCTHPDWENNLEAAKMKLVHELGKRFRYLIDSSEED